jgi:hypothetical protein
MEFTQQGTLGSGSTILYTCPVGKTARVYLKFNNPSANTITLSKYDAVLMITTDIYTFSLSAGDYLADNNYYLLQANDYLTVNCSAAGTNYLNNITELP